MEAALRAIGALVLSVIALKICFSVCSKVLLDLLEHWGPFINRKMDTIIEGIENGLVYIIIIEALSVVEYIFHLVAPGVPLVIAGDKEPL